MDEEVQFLKSRIINLHRANNQTLEAIKNKTLILTKEEEGKFRGRGAAYETVLLQIQYLRDNMQAGEMERMMLKGKWVNITCSSRASLNCHKELNLCCVVFPDCIKEATDLGWDVKSEICPACQEEIIKKSVGKEE